MPQVLDTAHDHSRPQWCSDDAGFAGMQNVKMAMEASTYISKESLGYQAVCGRVLQATYNNVLYETMSSRNPRMFGDARNVEHLLKNATGNEQCELKIEAMWAPIQYDSECSRC